MRSQYEFYVAVTAQVAILHEQLAAMKEQFLATYRVDVFADYDRKAQQASLQSAPSMCLTVPQRHTLHKCFMACALIRIADIRVNIPPPSVFPGSTTPAAAGTAPATASTAAPATNMFSMPAFGASAPAFPSSSTPAAGACMLYLYRTRAHTHNHLTQRTRHHTQHDTRYSMCASSPHPPPSQSRPR